MQERRNSIANTLELRLPCTNPLIWTALFKQNSFIAGLLWTAPELLRAISGPVVPTETGDVYSYGIVLLEIVERDYPYGSMELEPTGKQGHEVVLLALHWHHMSAIVSQFTCNSTFCSTA